MFPKLNDDSWANEDLQRVDRCYKLLLDADSDISSVTQRGGEWVSAFWKALLQDTVVRRPYRDRSI